MAAPNNIDDVIDMQVTCKNIVLDNNRAVQDTNRVVQDTNTVVQDTNRVVAQNRQGIKNIQSTINVNRIATERLETQIQAIQSNFQQLFLLKNDGISSPNSIQKKKYTKALYC